MDGPCGEHMVQRCELLKASTFNVGSIVTAEKCQTKAAATERGTQQHGGVFSLRTGSRIHFERVGGTLPRQRAWCPLLTVLVVKEEMLGSRAETCQTSRWIPAIACVVEPALSR